MRTMRLFRRKRSWHSVVHALLLACVSSEHNVRVVSAYSAYSTISTTPTTMSAVPSWSSWSSWSTHGRRKRPVFSLSYHSSFSTHRMQRLPLDFRSRRTFGTLLRSSNDEGSSMETTSNSNSNKGKDIKDLKNEAQFFNYSSEFFLGAPSTPGFKPGQFDKLTDWAMSTASNRPIVEEYEPDGFWLWTRFQGTVREMVYKEVGFALLLAVLVDLYAYQHYTIYILATAAVNGGDVTTLLQDVSWISLEIPHSKDPFLETLAAINSLWEYQLSLTIFTLSFFVNNAYTYWRQVYSCTRAIQGRINDLCLLVALAARRGNRYGEVEGITGFQSREYVSNSSNLSGSSKEGEEDTRDAKKLVNDVSRLLRMSHTFFWASTPTCSDGLSGIMKEMNDAPKNFDATKVGPMLLSGEGLNMLVECGQLTARERDALIATGLPPSQYSYVLLEWAGLRIMDGMESGELRGGQGMEENVLRQLSLLRGEYFNIGDYQAGRMPMAYVQVLEVLVDTLVLFSPLALYTKMGAFNIVASGYLMLFFKGLLELSKSFLDPFGTEGYRAHNIRTDVLVSELNFGASRRWFDAGDAMPSEKIVGKNQGEESTDVSGTQGAKGPMTLVEEETCPVLDDGDLINGENVSAHCFTPVTGSVAEEWEDPEDQAPDLEPESFGIDAIISENINGFSDVRDTDSVVGFKKVNGFKIEHAQHVNGEAKSKHKDLAENYARINKLKINGKDDDSSSDVLPNL